MPNPEVRLEFLDASEIAETLTFISQWLASTDHAQLADSFCRFVGTDGYDLNALRTDLAPLYLPARPRRRRTTIRPRHPITARYVRAQRAEEWLPKPNEVPADDHRGTMMAA